MTQGHEVKDYWSFVEKIQDATDYVQEVLVEKARLEKTVGKLHKDLGGLEGRLKNPKFRENAGEDVVRETEELAATKREELSRLQTALSRLDELA